MNEAVLRFTLVIPTYNEAGNIEELIARSRDALSASNVDFEIIVVDDDSPDRTWEIVQKISEEDKRVRLIRRQGCRGLASAVAAGWKAAAGDVLGVIDADLQHPPEAVPLLLGKLKDHPSLDIAIASRKVKRAADRRRSTWRKFVSGAASVVAGAMFPGIIRGLRDPMSGFFILKKEVIAGKKLDPRGYKILLEVLVKGDYDEVAEVPYEFVERGKGKSKAGIREYLRSFFYLFRLRFFAGRLKKLEMGDDL